MAYVICQPVRLVAKFRIKRNCGNLITFYIKSIFFFCRFPFPQLRLGYQIWCNLITQNEKQYQIVNQKLLFISLAVPVPISLLSLPQIRITILPTTEYRGNGSREKKNHNRYAVLTLPRLVKVVHPHFILLKHYTQTTNRSSPTLQI